MRATASTASRIRTTATAAGVGLVLWLGVGAPALAEPPLDMDHQLIDEAHVLTSEEEAELEAALTDLSREDDIDMYIVLVDSFDGAAGDDWAWWTFAASDLGEDAVVWAVAVQDRAYGFHEDTEISENWATEVATTMVEPELREDRWGPAMLAAVDGYRNPPPFPWLLFGGIWALVLSVIGGFWTYLGFWDRGKRREEEDEVIERRRALAAEVVALEELSGAAGSEADYAAADLGAAEEDRLRELSQRADEVIGSTSSTLEHLPAERGRRTPKRDQLKEWRKRLSRYEGKMHEVTQDLKDGVERVRTARTLIEDPSLVPALAARITSLQTQAADTRALVSAPSERPGWVTARLQDLLDTADLTLEAGEKEIGTAGRALGRGPSRAAEAGAYLTMARRDFTDAEHLLARVADPDQVVEDALEELRPRIARLGTLVEEGRTEVDEHDRYVRSAGKVGRKGEWSTKTSAPLEGAIAAAAALVDRGALVEVDPVQQAGALDEATASLTQQLGPYRSISQALKARARRRSGGGGGGRSGGGGGGGSSSGGGRF